MPIRKIIFYGFGVLIVASVGAAFFYGRSSALPRTVSKAPIQAAITVEMTDMGFKPSEFRIRAGEVVAWINHGSSNHWPASDFHPTHGIYPEFDPKEPILPGGQWTFQFDRVGKWRFHDHLHPLYAGTVEVVE